MKTLTGLIGYPVSHSLSPRIHEYWIKEHGLDAEYKLFTTPSNRLRQVVMRLRNKNAVGFNVTIPYKQSVMEFLDGVDDLALRIGAVNTVTRQKNGFTGTNTDAYGFITNLKEGLGEFAPYLGHAVVLGAGGATRAALIALIDAGVKRITLTNRTQDKANELAKLHKNIKVISWGAREEALRDATLLVNTTSLGMNGHEPLVMDIENLPATAAVHDIVYAPLETELLKNAKARELKTVDGLGMLLYQAQAAFKEWHGILPQVTPALREYALSAP